MAAPKVTGYTAYMDFGDRPHQGILLYEDRHQVGAISFTDPLLFMATIDILRNEGPNIGWDETHTRLDFGLEPTGEGEG